MLSVEIDQDSGFCFGVVNAIQKAEKELGNGKLYCLGDIVHNSQEVERLRAVGLETIDHKQFKKLKNVKVLLRAHGEPPETYRIARENNIEIIDATCPVVLQLQRKIHRHYYKEKEIHIIMYGKAGHAEVNGLVGQTEGKAIVIGSKDDLHLIDFSKPVCLFAQTTESLDGFKEIVEIIQSRMLPGVKFFYFDTICRQVANRIPHIREFAGKHDLVLFVAGKKSSNGKALFEECKKSNENTYLISGPEEIMPEWLNGINSVGICGATSTPKWLMEEVAEKIRYF